MNSRDKLLEKARRGMISYKDFQILLQQQGWSKIRSHGSHAIWRSPYGYRLPTQPDRSGMAKAYQVDQFFQALEKE